MKHYEIACSALLDHLWEDEDFRAYFHDEGYDLRAVAKLVRTVFLGAYLKFRECVPAGELESIQQDVIDHIMLQMVRNPAFIDVWRNWTPDEQDSFLEEQVEEPLALALADRYPGEAQSAYREAFDTYLARQGA
jgi:hypothetical protein